MRIDPQDLAAPAVAAGAILATASAQGGFLPATWSWVALALALAAGGAAVWLDSFELGRLDLVFLGALALFCGWVLLSARWSASPPRSILETQRTLVYFAASATVLLTALRRSVVLLFGAILAATSGVVCWGLTTQLFPDRFGLDLTWLHRLARPLGYPNGVGALAAMSLLLALAGATWSGRGRLAAAALVPPLGAALYLTFSRASLIALGLGLAVFVGVHPRRALALAIAAMLALTAAIGIWLTVRSPALTDSNPSLADATHEGRLIAVALAILAVVAACVPALVDAAAHRWSPRIRVPLPRRSVQVGLTAVVILAILALLARPAYDAFRSPLGNPANLNTRLLSPSGRGRADYWRVAWDDARDHPVLGSGAGTFQVRWFRDRPNTFTVLDAHELYLETLAEVGLVGLALLVLALGMPFLALRQVRGPWEAGAAAAYAAYLAHAAADWDWELPTVTLAALACGCALLAAARPPRAVQPMPGLVRAGAFAAAAAVVVVAGTGYLASNAIGASVGALRARDFSTAERQARRARTLEPWSPAPWNALGDAQLAAGDTAAALASYRRAVDKDPQNWLLWYLIAQNSKGSERAAAIRAGLRLNPRSPELAALRRS